MLMLFPDAFLQWAGDRKIGRNPRYPDSEHLVFTDVPGDSRYWAYPRDASAAPHFVESLLSAVGPVQQYWLYPRRGYWSLGGPFEDSPQTRIWKTALQGAGIPAGFVGAVGIEPTKPDNLSTVLCLQITLGPAVHIDTLVVPEDGRAVLYFEHHEVVWAQFREPPAMRAAVNTLERAGYPLPEEAPDDTFKPVSWMAPGQESDEGDL